MAVLSISEAARAVSRSPSVLYKRIRAGTLSATTLPDGSKGVETEELRRVFGEPQSEMKPGKSESSSGEESPVAEETEKLRQELTACRARARTLQAQVNKQWFLPGAVWDFMDYLGSAWHRLWDNR